MPRPSLLSYTGTSGGHIPGRGLSIKGEIGETKISAGDSSTRSCEILSDICNPLFMRDLRGLPGGPLKAKLLQYMGCSVPDGVILIYGK